jgi:hypothetical protein
VINTSVTDRQAFTWVERDVPAATLALLKNYTDPSKNVSGKSYPIVNACMPYAELAALTGKGASPAADLQVDVDLNFQRSVWR